MDSLGVNRRTREAMVAGIFYPDDPTMLAERVGTALSGYEASSDSPSATRPMAILSPHAAFDYSCDVQAAAWASTAGAKLDRVIILAPLLRADDHGVYLPETEVFQTPLGDIEVDSGACADLESCNTLFIVNDIPHFESHAIEIQLPFMKTLFPEALLVPILVSGDKVIVQNLARAIGMVFGDDMDRTLIVASSNLASSILRPDAAERSKDLLDLIKSGDWKSLCAQKDVVGLAAIASVMASHVIQDTHFQLLAYDDSHKQASSTSEGIVHYAAAAWYGGE
ncbi:MAG: AmmeMemoRadiSam system protein B [Spirochaetia bacterium]|nr:AmmeMemoRadiSam system protein B [Spirochaetia bacterium]